MRKLVGPSKVVHQLVGKSPLYELVSCPDCVLLLRKSFLDLGLLDFVVENKEIRNVCKVKRKCVVNLMGLL